MQFDHIVVGAGVAGCVVATRLAEANRRVLLLEAGPDLSPDPESVRSPFPISHGVPHFAWRDLSATLKAPRPGSPAPTATPYLQARLVGGGGALMGMIALRGSPQDYDEWRDRGARGWGWDDVLPHFRKLESDLDFDTDLHGQTGPIPVRRHDKADWSPFARAMGEAFEADGYPAIGDANADFRDGHIAIPCSNLPDRRVSSKSAYLDAKARARANFTLLATTQVERVLIRDRKVTGVSARTRTGVCSFSAREVVLCAGAIGSPLLLLKSGIGPAADLQAAGVPVAADVAGVGKNLCNHPIAYLSVLLPQGARRPKGPLIYNALRYSSGLQDCPPHDMLMPLINRTAWHALGDAIASVGVAVYKSASRGRVALSLNDGKPAIELGLFADGQDMDRMVEGFKKAFRYLRAASRTGAPWEIFVSTTATLTRTLADPTWPHGAVASAIAMALDGPAPIRNQILRGAGICPAPLMRDDDALADFIYRHASPMYHPAGTCRIGASDDPLAVVDHRCRVRSVAGLRVADASVMPSIVRANTNIPTLMIGEKAAAMIEEDDR